MSGISFRILRDFSAQTNLASLGTLSLDLLFDFTLWFGSFSSNDSPLLFFLDHLFVEVAAIHAQAKELKGIVD